MNKRDYSFDNIKFILILLVVFGHILEIAGGFGSESALYKVIYSFHIPTLVFISGYFAKFNKRKIIIFLFIYLLFQILYICFMKFILDEEIAFQFTTPYWLLWFLFVYIMYQLITPLIDIDYNKFSKKYCYIKMIIVLVISFLLSLFLPYIKTIGKYLSLGRFFSFLPYFLIGYYLKKIVNFNDGFLFKLSKKHKLFTKVLFIVLTLISIVLVIAFDDINSFVYYASKNYHVVSCYNPLTKLFTFFCAFSFIGFLTYTVRFNIRIPLISFIGQNTLLIYLFHGFLVKPLKYINIITDINSNIFLLILISLIIVLFLGNPIFEYFSKEFIYGRAYIRIFEKIKIKFSKKED